jgi:hypothetical protein
MPPAGTSTTLTPGQSRATCSGPHPAVIAAGFCWPRPGSTLAALIPIVCPDPTVLSPINPCTSSTFQRTMTK